MYRIGIYGIVPLLFAPSFISCVVPGKSPGTSQEIVGLQAVTGLDLFVPVPDENPLTRAKIALGEKLFFDPLLSRDKSTSCSSCHLPQHAFSDTTSLSRGAAGRIGKRNAPSLINRAYGRAFFWDGRITSLEQQVMHPIADPVEMDLPSQEMVKRLRSKKPYDALFRDAYRRAPDSTGVALALASYIRTLRSGNSPHDLANDGDSSALTPAARRGAALFTGKARCTTCHIPPNFSDELFHNTGVAARTAARRDGVALDPGRVAITGVVDDSGAFKTPTLRDVERSAPYMHDGSFAALEDVVAFYSEGGHANPHLSGDIRALGLSPRDRVDLVEFLKSLTGRRQDDAVSASR